MKKGLEHVLRYTPSSEVTINLSGEMIAHIKTSLPFVLDRYLKNVGADVLKNEKNGQKETIIEFNFFDYEFMLTVSRSPEDDQQDKSSVFYAPLYDINVFMRDHEEIQYQNIGSVINDKPHRASLSIDHGSFRTSEALPVMFHDTIHSIMCVVGGLVFRSKLKNSGLLDTLDDGHKFTVSDYDNLLKLSGKNSFAIKKGDATPLCIALLENLLRDSEQF